MLRRAEAAARTGAGQVVLVCGDAGIGKTALLRTAFPAAAVGHVVPGEVGAMSALAELCADLSRAGAQAASPGMGPYAAAVRRMLPGLWSGDGTAGGVAGQGESAHPIVVGDAILRLWATLPVPRRPVLVVEDLHWVDDATWAVLTRMVRAAPASGVLLVLTSRPDGDRWADLGRFVETGDASAFELAPLDDESVAALVAGRLGVPSALVPATALDAVRPAGGWPLYVVDLLDGAVANAEGVRRTGSGLGGLRLSITERLDRLSDRTVLERAAVLGARLDVGLLAASFGANAERVADAARAGTAAGLLVTDADGSVAFRHEVHRQCVLGNLVDVERAEHASALVRAALGVTEVHSGLPADVGADLPDDRLALVAGLADVAGEPDLAGDLLVALAARLMQRGLPLAAADAAARARHHAAVRDVAAVLEVQARALAGQVDTALAVAAGLRGRLDADSERSVRLAIVRATTHSGDWAGAARLLEHPLTTGPLDSPGAAHDVGSNAELLALRALVALELSHTGNAREWARAALAANPGPSVQCEAMEVLGRIARSRDLDEAAAWFGEAVGIAERHGLALWRARALHEAATIAQLRTLDLGPLHLARRAAVDAGAPGLVSSVDFHLAAVLGVRFEPDEALVVARRLLDDAWRHGATGMQAWAWVLIGQAHATAGRQVHAGAAADEALSLAPDDLELAGAVAGTCRALPALLTEHRVAAVAQLVAGVDALRRSGSPSPLPTWYLWPVLATVADVEGDGGRRAREETTALGLRVAPGIDALWHLAHAVDLGRRGDVSGADDAAAAAERALAALPGFAGWRHLGTRLVADDAIRHHWGRPAVWAGDAADWFAAHDLPVIAGACRGLAARAGVKRRRRGRGSATVPAHLDRLGVTSREMDVLLLLAEGLTNPQIAERLYLSPATVKTYVEQLLAKTGAPNRTRLASTLPPPGRDGPT